MPLEPPSYGFWQQMSRTVNSDGFLIAVVLVAILALGIFTIFPKIMGMS